MYRLIKALNRGRVVPTLKLAAVALLATWMGDVNGGYFVGGWAPVALLLAGLLLLGAVSGALRGVETGWSGLALGLFVAYAAWTFASILWSPNQGAAWIGPARPCCTCSLSGSPPPYSPRAPIVAGSWPPR